MRHLFVTNDFPPKTGGIESYLVSLCSGFDPADVVVIAPSRAGRDGVDSKLPYEVVRLPGRYLRASGRSGRRVMEVARSRRVDAVHFLQALPLGRLARSVRSALGLPVTIFAHGSEVFVPGRTPLLRRVMARALASADLVYAVSEFTRGAVRQLTRDRVPVVLLPPSVDVERFSLRVSGAPVRQRHGLGSRFAVLFVSRLVKRKAADVLINAMTRLPRAAALIVGTGPEEASLRRLAADLELDERVVFAGAVVDAELPAYYAAADVFCMPCSTRHGGLDTEGFGIVYLEAAASGLPAVAGECGGSVEAVVDGETGVVLRRVNPKSVAQALRALADDPTLGARLGAAGRLRAETQFAPDVMAARLEQELEDVLRARARSAS